MGPLERSFRCRKQFKLSSELAAVLQPRTANAPSESFFKVKRVIFENWLCIEEGVLPDQPFDAGSVAQIRIFSED